MTDKQIIDVTKCIHFDKSDIPNGCTCYWDGECNHDCYYKQLKHKEQECEKYKQALDEIEKIANEPCIIFNKICKECNNTCEHKDILNIINKAKDSK